MTLDHMQRKQLAAMIKADIDAYCVKTYSDTHRTHLGASIIGDDCRRRLWYIFRWARYEHFDGRMLRLFNRGHKEEERFIEWLEGIGGTVHALTDEGKQYRISGVEGHFGGSLDAGAKLPQHYTNKLGLPANFVLPPFLGEFKTSGTGSKFADLLKKGVALCKPKHYNQMCTYGRYYGFRYALYFCINKNDDDLYIEVVELDWQLGEDNLVKAHSVITAKEAPPKLSENPAHFECKYCHFSDICHWGQQPEKNCRSCKLAVAVENAQWFCTRYQQVIPADFIPKGCEGWTAIQ